MLSDMLTPRGVNIRNNKKASVSFVRRYENWRFSIFGLTNAFMHESTFLSWIASANIHIFFDTAPSGDKVSSKYKEIRVIFFPFFLYRFPQMRDYMRDFVFFMVWHWFWNDIVVDLNKRFLYAMTPQSNTAFDYSIRSTGDKAGDGDLTYTLIITNEKSLMRHPKKGKKGVLKPRWSSALAPP